VNEPTHTPAPDNEVVRRTNLHLLKFLGFRLQWVRALAQGGNGAATLWRAVYEDGTKEFFVMKILTGRCSPSSRAEKVQRERHWHDRYARAEHIVQHSFPTWWQTGTRLSIHLDRGYTPVTLLSLIDWVF
jgi:hypothetical protein